MGNRHTSASIAPALSPPSEADVARVELEASARLASTSLLRSAVEVNLFLAPVLGVDVAGFAARFCSFTGFDLVREAGARHARVHTSLRDQQLALSPLAWDSPTAAAEYLIASQLASVVLALPRDGGGGGEGHVRVYTRSPAEDRHVAMPLLLDGRVDAALLALLQSAVDTAWAALEEHCSPQCSAWVYLRLTDASWARMLTTAPLPSPVERERMMAWRRRMDEFFYESHFRFTRHSVVVEVHCETVASEAVLYDVVDLVAGFVLEQLAEGMWSETVERRAFRTYLSSERYQRARIRQAVHARTVSTKLQLLGDATVAPLSLASTAVPLTALPRVSPHRVRGRRRELSGEHVYTYGDD